MSNFYAKAMGQNIFIFLKLRYSRTKKIALVIFQTISPTNNEAQYDTTVSLLSETAQ